MYKHILVTTDGSELAAGSVQQGIALAAALSAPITVLTVIKPLHTVAPAAVMIALPPAEYEKGAQKHADQILEHAREAAKQAGVACTTKCTTHDEPSQAIIETAADAGCDLIVMGSHGRTGLTQLVLGSQTQKVLSHTSVPVLVTR
jgi:nucleotide-binding universal stress UspA family protein